MAGKYLQKVKEHPLLSQPPQEEPWMRVTSSDKKAIKAALEEDRKKGQGLYILSQHESMRQLGLGEQITKEDIEAIEKQFRIYRGALDGVGLVQMHSLAKTLELKYNVLDEDLKLIDKYYKDLKMGEDGRHFAWLHYHMKMAGLPRGISGEDEALMLKHLEELRAGNGDQLVSTLFFMNELGLSVSMTREDRGMAREKLERARKEGEGGMIAGILAHLRTIPMANDASPPDIPPLKRYKG